MSNVQNKSTKKNSIQDAYRAPSIPERLHLANAVRFWFAFAMVLIGHAMAIIGIAVFRPLTETWWIGIVLMVGGCVLAYWIAKRIDSRIYFNSARQMNLRLVSMVGVLLIVLLMLIDDNFLNRQLIGGMKSKLLFMWPLLLAAFLHIVSILDGMIAETMPRLPVDLQVRFTDRTRVVIQLAKDASGRLKQDVGSEHVLLGLVQEGKGVAANVMRYLSIDTARIVSEVESLAQSQSDKPKSKNELGFIVQHAMEESTALGHHYIGTEHLLLGLLQYREGVAAAILTKLGTSADEIRQHIQDLLGLDLPSASEPKKH